MFNVTWLRLRPSKLNLHLLDLRSEALDGLGQLINGHLGGLDLGSEVLLLVFLLFRLELILVELVEKTNDECHAIKPWKDKPGAL